MYKTMIHCSFDIVEDFEPRIPKNRIEGSLSEDSTTPRICAAPDIKHALLAIPQAAKCIDLMQKLQIPVIIHAYELAGDFYAPSEKEVPDVWLTSEEWLLKKPDTVKRRDYEITDCRIEYIGDENGNTCGILHDLRYVPTCFQNNKSNLSKRIKRSKDTLEGSDFRTIIVNIGSNLLELLSWKNKKKHCLEKDETAVDNMLDKTYN